MFHGEIENLVSKGDIRDILEKFTASLENAAGVILIKVTEDDQTEILTAGLTDREIRGSLVDALAANYESEGG